MKLSRNLALVLASLVITTSTHAQWELQKVHASDPGFNDWFGFSSDLDGTRALVGAVWDSNAGALDGSAYVFVDTGSGWVEEAKLTAGDAGADDMLGITVSLSGDWALCGAYRDDDIASNSGSAYFFERTGGGWIEVQKLKAADASADDRFGWGTAVDGTRAVVGAYQDDDNGNQSGSAYVFEFSAGSWSQTAKLTASDGAAGDAFGRDVAIDGDVIVVAAQSVDGVGSNSGACYVFEWSGSDWVETAKLEASDGAASDAFGVDIFVQGSRVLVGADGHDGVASNTGAGYLFEKLAGNWVETAKLEAPDAQSGDRLGISVALDDGRAVLGAWLDDDGGSSSGSAYVFDSSTGSWKAIAKLTASDPGAQDQFGYTVSILGDVVLVGSRWDDDGFTSAGSAYFYSVPADATPYGFCESGAPCGNGDALAGCDTSLGRGARLVARGSTSVGADDLILAIQGVAGGQFGIVYMGAGQISSSFGDGLRVVSAGGVGTYRFPPHAANAAQSIEQGPGLAAHALANFNAAGQITPGSTWNFQGWFRDPAGPCGSGFNLTAGLSVEFGL